MNNSPTKDSEVLLLSSLQHSAGELVLMQLINPLNTKRRLLYLKTQFEPRSKLCSSRL